MRQINVTTLFLSFHGSMRTLRPLDTVKGVPSQYVAQSALAHVDTRRILRCMQYKLLAIMPGVSPYHTLNVSCGTWDARWIIAFSR